jgi:hypothetical protein
MKIEGEYFILYRHINLMDLLPTEIIAMITYKTISGDNNGIYNIPALMLTNKKLNSIITPLHVYDPGPFGEPRRRIRKSIMEYYVHLGSQSGIDFAISLGRYLADIHIVTCLSNGYDITLDYILTKYGLPNERNTSYTSALLYHGTCELVDRFASLGFKPNTLFLLYSYDCHDPVVFRKLISLLTLDDKDEIISYGTINNINSLFSCMAYSGGNENNMVEKYKILNEFGLLDRNIFCEAVYRLYEEPYPLCDYPGYSKLAVEMYSGVTNIVRRIQENPARPNITKIFANAPHLIIVRDV